MTTDRPLRVVIADDQASVREGLVLLLGGLPGIDVVGAAADGEQALELVAEQQPDAILLDLHMPVLDGIGATRRLGAEHPGRRDRRAHHLRGRHVRPRGAPRRRAQLPHQGRRPHRHRAGAAGRGGRADRVRSARARHLARRRGPGRCSARRRVARQRVSRRPVGRGAAAAPGPRPSAPPDGLTQREAEILSLIAQGLTNGEIAERLFLSNHTIKTHINRIFAKTGSRDRVAAIGYAQRHHIG